MNGWEDECPRTLILGEMFRGLGHIKLAAIAHDVKWWVESTHGDAIQSVSTDTSYDGRVSLIIQTRVIDEERTAAISSYAKGLLSQYRRDLAPTGEDHQLLDAMPPRWPPEEDKRAHLEGLRRWLWRVFLATVAVSALFCLRDAWRYARDAREGGKTRPAVEEMAPAPAPGAESEAAE
ncbi:MAG: hypothetical protein JXR94_00875 [Candidatus Hydrogenedentes bacterium]|nr:hypothetical protein [Candidatus Hydrogenedentota bacterium]